MIPSSSDRSVVSSGNFSPAINVINWFMAAVIAFFVGTRIAMKLVRALKIGRDDIIILLSTIFSFALVATVTIQTANGLGKHVDKLSPTELMMYQKAEYSGDMCFVLSVMLSKISILLLLYFITPVLLHIRLIVALGCTIIIWGVSAFLVAIFQCKVPGVWQLLGSHCVEKASFWTYLGISNIVIEVALITLPMFIVQEVHVIHSAKVLVISCFGLRLLVIGCLIPQVLFVRKISNSADPTSDSWPVVICSIFVQSFSIITACIPYLKPFFASLESGMLRTDDLRRRDGTATFNTKGKLNSDQIIGRSRKAKKNGSSRVSALILSPWQQIPKDIVGQKASTVTEAVGGNFNRQVIEGDVGSQTSLSRFIQQTRTWEVSHT